jgi:OOP family OmpA-OmpF porin
MVFSLATLGLIQTDIHAQVKAGSISMSHSATGYAFEKNLDYEQDFEDGPGYTFGLEYDFTDHVATELGFQFFKAELDDYFDDETFESYGIRLDFLYHFRPEKRLVPYLAGGVGYSEFVMPENLENVYSPFSTVGGGLKYFVTDRVALRGDVRHLYYTEEEENHFSASLGLTFVLGTVGEEPAPKDADGDGVIDTADACPNTPLGVPVYLDGCIMDRDGDGVYDDIDRCPDTPAGTKVDIVGCRKEREPLEGMETGPAVAAGPDEMDEGKITEGIEVADKGPETAETSELIEYKDENSIITRNRFRVVVRFDYDKTAIKEKYFKVLNKIAGQMKDNPEIRALIEGHTDSVGTETYNMGLSERRARSVKKYFTNRYGIDPGRFEIQWYGEEKPVASNESGKGRRKNRRAIVIRIDNENP